MSVLENLFPPKNNTMLKQHATVSLLAQEELRNSENFHNYILVFKNVLSNQVKSQVNLLGKRTSAFKENHSFCAFFNCNHFYQ